MGSISQIASAFRELSERDQLQLLHQLLEEFRAPKETKRYKHPIFELAGRWTVEEGNEMERIIKEGDWIDDGSSE